MLFTNNALDAFRGRTAHIEYDNAIQYAGHLTRKTGDKDILPGMVVKHLGNKEMALFDGTGDPFGLASVFVAPGFGQAGINQLGQNGEFTAIVGTNNTTVRIDAEALDPESTFKTNEDGSIVPLYANNNGRISMTGTKVIGNLLEVNQDKSIVIQLHAPAVA